MYTSLHERMAEFEQYRDQLLANKREVLFDLFHTETTMVEAIELATEELGSRLIEKATLHAKVDLEKGNRSSGSEVSLHEPGSPLIEFRFAFDEASLYCRRRLCH